MSTPLSRRVDFILIVFLVLRAIFLARFDLLVHVYFISVLEFRQNNSKQSSYVYPDFLKTLVKEKKDIPYSKKLTV